MYLLHHLSEPQVPWEKTGDYHIASDHTVRVKILEYSLVHSKNSINVRNHNEKSGDVARWLEHLLGSIPRSTPPPPKKKKKRKGREDGGREQIMMSQKNMAASIDHNWNSAAGSQSGGEGRKDMTS